MRPIKFRAKRVDNGEWVYGYVLETRMSGVYIIGTKQTMKSSQYEVKIGDRLWQHEVDPETVGEFTGLKDKDGREIYEGDVLEEQPNLLFQVIWDSKWAKFKLQHIRHVAYPEWNRGIQMQVVGNIYSNPELLGDAP